MVQTPTFVKYKKNVLPINKVFNNGFTLLELMVVISIIAIASVGVIISLPNENSVKLEREAQRLAALLDSGRAQSRATGLEVKWQMTESGFKFNGINSNSKSELLELTNWMEEEVTVIGESKEIILGPEPILEKQKILLQLADQKIQVSTDGLHPFKVSQIPQ
jgi:general secretion pathway protein H